jgi:biotin operon repressor
LSSDTVIPEDIAAFIRDSVPSIWTLELLLFLRKNEGSAWSTDQLIRELRGSRLLVIDIIASLERAGLVVEESDSSFRYGPTKAEVDDLILRLDRLSVERPMAVRNAIVSAPHDRVQVFADAFRVKKE